MEELTIYKLLCSTLSEINFLVEDFIRHKVLTELDCEAINVPS